MENDQPVGSDEAVHCRNCANRIVTAVGLYAVCAGPCAQSFHITCIGLSREHLRSLTKGVIWMCRECSSCFQKWKESSAVEPETSDTKSLRAEITDLKTQVAGILNTLSSITSIDNSTLHTTPIQHSTPVTSTKLLNGTRENYERAKDSGQAEQNKQQLVDPVDPVGGTSEDNRCFSLLLSNIDSRVSENDVRSLVCQCTGAPSIDCEKVVKLVPRRIDCRTLDFVSFKIVLKEKWKPKAMDASTWPCGVKYRQFLNRSSNAWIPS